MSHYKFEKLEVWQLARSFSTQVYTATQAFPAQERFGITSQIRRATISVGLNIAEGSDRRSDKDFISYLRISHGSLSEVIAALYIARDLGYIDQTGFDSIYQESAKLAAKIKSLINYLNK